ncbi:MAG: hypothetical protein KBD48_03200, partial [Candidatus Pacebacteria bacterium]|nr:hypothetical protein [Candidatus Paceibacterota bacterium]
YLILLFLSKGFMGLFYTNAQGAEFVLQTLVPFIVIMILLWQAKSVASDMSKGVASSVTTGLKVAGVAALGLTGAGVGWAGRNVIGKTMAKASSGTTATQKYEAAKAALTTAGGRDPSLYNALSKKEKILGNIGSKMQLGKVFGKTQVTAAVDERGRRIANTASVGGVQGGIGGAINKSQKKVGGVNHAVHDYEETAKEAHIDPKRKFNELSEIEKGNMKKSFYSLNKSKFETKIKNGLVDGTESEADYKTRERNVQTAAWAAAGHTPTTEDKNKLETKLSNDYKTVTLEPALKDKLSHDFTHTMEGASEKISFKDRITSDAPSGSYNPLSLSKLQSTKNDALSTALIFGITSAIASGMRTGMKNVPQMNMGIGARTFKDDMKSIFSEALKGANFKLESSGGGHGGGHDDHGGGHDDHGHGGH